MATSKFVARFSRYKTGVTVVSGPWAFQAEDFQDAFKQANLVRYGMEMADKVAVFEIESIKQDALVDPVQAGGYVFDLFRMEDDDSE